MWTGVECMFSTERWITQNINFVHSRGRHIRLAIWCVKASPLIWLKAHVAAEEYVLDRGEQCSAESYDGTVTYIRIDSLLTSTG